MSVLLFSSDLMISSQITGHARAIGLEVKVIGSLAQLREELTSSDLISLLMLDLSSKGVDPEEIQSAIREGDHTVETVVAFGPHVHREKLAAAKAAGCDEVMSRGQFVSQLEDLLKSC